MKKFNSKVECNEYIHTHDLNTIPIPVYSEDDVILYWIIYNVN